jgi:leucyl-tRNA synthetase
MKQYDHTKIEKKWQKVWESKKPNKVKEDKKKKKFYALIEFPYPSGDGLHVGHIRSNTAMDIISRKRRREGYNVLYPIGWDAFGLPTENYAIKTGIQPAVVTKKNTDTFRRQLKSLGFSFDWFREINTTDPKYYKWTQWIFLQFLKNGLAYKKKMAINWCPKDLIGLANEEVINGKCERCGTTVEKRDKEQWMLAITKYADRLDKDLDETDFLEKIKIQQRNWIGKSEGVNLTFNVKDSHLKFEMFDSIPQTFMAQTFTVIAPDHPQLYELVKGTEYEEKVMKKAKEIIERRNKGEFESINEMDGIFTGRYIDYTPAKRQLPIWVASFVLADYGTGIVNCSYHDERDYLFAKKFNIDLHPVLFPADEEKAKLVRNKEIFYREPDGILQEPVEFKGRRWDEVRSDIIDYIVKNNYGKKSINYKLRDWVFSRQRYWGEPIPVVHCEKCGVVPVPEKDLPITLPKVKNYAPTGNGESPLAAIDKWVNTKCPNCKCKAKRETDTMPQWAGSSWYYLRYMDPKNNKEFVGKKSLNYWNQVDWYNGGMEHTTLHLLYSRFWHKFLFDLGLVPTSEPYKKRTSHGLILAQGGEKMSKSKGNVVSPDELVKVVGADTLRIHEMFMGPFDQAIAWDTNTIAGSRRFLERVWKLQDKIGKIESEKIDIAVNKAVKKVTEDIEAMRFNTAISSMMILINEFEKEEIISKNNYQIFLQLLAPFAPHITEEIWSNLKNKKSIHQSDWPSYNNELIKEDKTKIVIQINGKVRGTIEGDISESEDQIKTRVLELPDIQKWVNGQNIKKVIYIKGKLINLVL